MTPAEQFIAEREHFYATQDEADKTRMIVAYIDHIANTAMGKKKSLEFIKKFVEMY